MFENISSIIKTVNESYKSYTVGVVWKDATFTWHENTSKVELVGNNIVIHAECLYEYELKDILGLTLVD